MADVSGLLALAEADARSGPPPTDTSYPKRRLLSGLTLNPLALGGALGLSMGIMFVLISILVTLSGVSPVLGFLRILFPGFNPGTATGVFIGFAWTAAYGFLAGAILAMVYNSLIKHSTFEGGSFEHYA